MTKTIFPTDPNFSRPFHLMAELPSSYARIGGHMPEGLAAPLRADAEYFGTFPLYEAEFNFYFSLFINGPFAARMAALNAGLQTDDRMVVVAHAGLPRSASAQYASKLSQHALALGAVQPDTVPNEAGENVIRERHKFGGRPFCIQEPTLPGAEVLLAAGYHQVLQVDFPNLDDGQVVGGWPFGDGMFNLFWRYPFVGETYYWYLQG